MMIFTTFQLRNRVRLISILLFGGTLWAQPSPVDLVGGGAVDLSFMSFGDLLNTEISDEEPSDEVQFRTQSIGPISVNYRYSRMRFDGYRDGVRKMSFQEVLSRYPVVPTVIIQEAHAVEAGFDWKDYNIRLVVPYIRQSTDHIARKVDPFNITSQGLGDLDVSIGCRSGDQRNLWIYRGGVSFPTGSIDETGTTPRGPGTLIPYTMQLGSGTVDLEPSIAYIRNNANTQLGTQLLGTIRTGRNKRNYSLSDRVQLSTWMNIRLSDWLEPSFKLNWISWSGIDGEDSALNPDLAPVANAALYGGHRLDAIIGANFRIPNETFDGLSMGVQAGIPVHEDLVGPQPGQDFQYSLSAGWNF